MKIPTKQEIERLHFENRISLAEIARRYDIPRWKMHEITEKYGIKSSYYKHLDKEEVKRLYIEEKLSAPKIAKIYGTSFEPIYTIIHSLGITKNMSECHMGQSAHNKGKPMAEEQRKKLSKSRIGKFNGEQNPNWKGGNSYHSNNPKRKVFGYRKWINSIRERDGKCLECGSTKTLHVHHIVPVRKIEDISLLTDPNNAITLCKKCHTKTIYREQEYEIFYRALLEKAVNSGKTQNGQS